LGVALGGGGLSPGFGEGTAEYSGAGYGDLDYWFVCLEMDVSGWSQKRGASGLTIV